MNIRNKFGMSISEEAIKNITSELFEMVKSNPNLKRPKLIGYVFANYKDEYKIDVICADQIEKLMESQHAEELKLLGYNLLDIYDPEYFKKH